MIGMSCWVDKEDMCEKVVLLETEIERLTTMLSALNYALRKENDKIEQLMEENDRLTKHVELYREAKAKDLQVNWELQEKIEYLTKKRPEEIEGVYDFANKLAKTILDLKSSHVFFLMQQAFGDETEWSDVEDMLNNIITLTEIR